VWVESESKKVGNLQVPEALMAFMREHGACVRIELSLADRVAVLLQEYDFFVNDPAYFARRLEGLVALCGHAKVQRWQTQGHSGEFAQAFEELLVEHYDPIYRRSMERNFAGYATALPVRPAGPDLPHFAQAAVKAAEAVQAAQAVQSFSAKSAA
jgi:tRNA 2-selenouridine synthase